MEVIKKGHTFESIIYSIDEIDSNKLEYEVTIKPQGFGDTQVYTRQLWL